MQKLILTYKNTLLGLVPTFVLLGLFYWAFSAITNDAAKALDIQLGFYLPLLQFVSALVSTILFRRELLSVFVETLRPKKHWISLSLVILFFGIFTATQVEKQHRVLSDETSWESLGLMMIHEHNGGVCNEGFYDKSRQLHCETVVNNFKGKSTPFMYYLSSFITEFDRDVALQLNFFLYLGSILLIFIILQGLENNFYLSLLGSICLGAFPKFIFQAQTATTEVLYVFMGLLTLGATLALRKAGFQLKHLFLIAPLMGFFTGTRLETVFAFGLFTWLCIPLFQKSKWNLPIFTSSVFVASLPAIITIAAYKGYDFQGGKHDAHSIANLISNLKENLDIMLGLKLRGDGLLLHPFSTVQSVWLYIATLYLFFAGLFNKALRKYYIPAILFFFQILVIMVNVSGTFAIDINQRYVLVAYPLFALLMAWFIFDLSRFIPNKKLAAGFITVFCLLQMGIVLYHTPSFNANIHYDRNKLLSEEKFLNEHLKDYPAEAIFFYSRPWQMLASGKNSWSETTLDKWPQSKVLQTLAERNGELYIVRGQDGYGNVNLNSKVVGFKTTHTQEKLAEKYECKEVLREVATFGYPLTICKILGLKKYSPFRSQVNVTNTDTLIKIEKQFSEPLKIRFLSIDTTMNESALIIKLPRDKMGYRQELLSFVLPDQDTLSHWVNFMNFDANNMGLNRLPMAHQQQDWGNLGINRSVKGNPLSIDGRPFLHGYGTHANSQIEFKLNQKFSKLHIGYGIDDEEGCGDGVTFEIQVNGVKIWSDGPIFIGKFKEVSLPINQGQNLKLVVHSNNNINCDHADWVHPWVQK